MTETTQPASSQADLHDAAGGLRDYQATYRKSELVIPGLVMILALFAMGITVIIRYGDNWDFEAAVFSLFGSTILALILLVNAGFRTHCWTITAAGIAIFERPRLRGTGFAHRRLISFADIAALCRVESGLDRQIEIVTRDGRRFRLSQRYLPAARGLAVPYPAAIDIDDFARSIHAAAAAAGYQLPAMAEGLSFWNSVPGLALLSVLLVLSLVMAGGVLWALLDGLTVRPGTRGGEAAAILLLLPVGAGYLLRKSWCRRRAVLLSLMTPVAAGRAP